MRLRYAGTCRICGLRILAKAEAVYERPTKTVRCISHDVNAPVEPAVARPVESTVTKVEEPVVARVVEPAVVDDGEPAVVEAGETPVAEVIDPGTPGASARREFERRKTRHEERVRTSHPKLGGLILALSDEKQSTTAWDVGAVGEERLGRDLDRLASATVRLLHDRRIPRSKANIDHLG